MNKIKNIIWRIFLTVMILIALYRLTAYSQTFAKDGEIPESVFEDKSNISNFNLYQNEPEKFLEVTGIKFEIYKFSNVRLKVFDKTGRLIETLVDGEMKAGKYNIYFKADDTLSAGEYIYQLEVNGSAQSKKMFLLKY